MAIQENKVVRLKKTFLSDLDSWHKVLEEESSSWVKSVVSHFDLNMDIVFGSDPGKSVSYLIQNKFFIDFNIKDGSIKISKDGHVVGEWKNISVKTSLDDDGSPFSKISVDAWSVKDKTNSNRHHNEQKNPSP